MAAYVQKPGISYVPAYQVSAIPYATASFLVPALGDAPKCVNFPLVTKFITIVNSGSEGPIRIGFSSLGVTGSENSANGVAGMNYYFTLDNGDSYTGEWRIENIYLLSNSRVAMSASIIAGLVGISTGSTPGFTAGTLNWSGSTGVG